MNAGESPAGVFSFMLKTFWENFSQWPGGFPRQTESPPGTR